MNESTSLIIPSGTPGLGALTLDLSKVYEAESLLPEVAAVTVEKAGYLMAVFNESYNELIKTIRTVDLECARSKIILNKIRSRIILDEAKDILKAKGLAKDSNPAGSEDLRRAVLEANEEYIQALDRLNFLDITSEFLRGKLKVMDNGYTAVKKLLGDQQNATYHKATGYEANLSDSVEVGTVEVRRGFVKPRI